MSDIKERFVTIYKEKIHRKGSERLLEWLEKYDFFTAPASTRFHSAFEGGLCRHSVLVYERLRVLFANEFCKGKELTSEQEETIAVVGLLHDLCKVQFYDVEMRNKKIDGQWQSVPTYVVNDKMPYGHGEKSVYLIKSFMGLTTDEAMAIRWHMGYTEADTLSFNNAIDRYPMIWALHSADTQASHFMENNEGNKPAYADNGSAEYADQPTMQEATAPVFEEATPV